MGQRGTGKVEKGIKDEQREGCLRIFVSVTSHWRTVTSRHGVPQVRAIAE